MMETSAPATACDPALAADIRRYGRFDTAGCYQCGSCTITCDLVTDAATFPRKVIRYGLLGLRDPLVQSLEPWICHDCGDCSIVCPREADPRISMMTVRRFLCAQYDWTGLASRILGSRAWYLGSLGFVAALTALLIASYHLYYVGLGVSDFTMPMGLEHVFPTMTYYTLVVILLPLVLLITHAIRMWHLTMRRGAAMRIPASVYAGEAWTYVKQSVTHTMIRRCPERGRWFGHWILALGTVMMLTIKTFALRWFQTDGLYPLYHPQRWLGYLATLFIVYGLGTIFVGRMQHRKEIYKQTRLEDVVFPILLLLTAFSGISVHIFRYAGMSLASHVAYALHVVIATPMLIVEMSFGKWSHMIYRPLALYLQAVKERAASLSHAGEVTSHAA